MDPRSLIEKIEEKIHYHQSPLKERIIHAIFRLKTQHEKLEETAAKLEQRDRILFEKCVGAKLAKSDEYATIYANECVEIRKMAKLILSSQLALEQVMLRLETIEEFGDVGVEIAPVIKIIQETKGRLTSILPAVAHELESVDSLLRNTLAEAGDLKLQTTTPEASSAEAQRIMEEASAIAEEKVNEKFPQLPVTLPTPEETSVKIAEAEGGATVVVEPTAIHGEPPSIEQEVYEYIKAHSGKLNLNQCASDLGVSPEALRKIIARLQLEGKIKAG